MNIREKHYKELLEKYKKLLIWNDKITEKRSLISTIVNALEEENQPVIFINYNEEQFVSSIFKGKYKEIYNISYSSISDIDRNGNNTIYIFDEYSYDYITMTSVAMLINQRLLKSGYRPLIIIDYFESLYAYNLDETLDEYFKYELLGCIDNTQNIVFISSAVDYVPGSNNQEKIIKVTGLMDAALISEDFLYHGFHGIEWGHIESVKNIAKSLIGGKKGNQISRTLHDMATQKLCELSYAYILDFKAGTMEEFPG